MKISTIFYVMGGFLSSLSLSSCNSTAKKVITNDTTQYIGFTKAICGPQSETSYADTLIVVRDNLDSISFYYKQLDCELSDQYSHLWITYLINDSGRYLTRNINQYIDFKVDFRVSSNDSLYFDASNERKVTGQNTKFSFSGKKSKKIAAR